MRKKMKISTLQEHLRGSIRYGQFEQLACFHLFETTAHEWGYRMIFVCVCVYRAADPCSANCEPVLLHTILMRGGVAVRSCWISSFSVKTRSPSESPWTCKSTRYPCKKTHFAFDASHPHTRVVYMRTKHKSLPLFVKLCS